MYEPSVSKAILAGLSAAGWSPGRIAKVLGPEADEIELISAGIGMLSDAAVRRIERATGMTAGQLAAKSLGSRDGGLTKLMDRWAALSRPEKLAGRSARATKARSR
jgi:hypothetical protein